MAAKKPESRDNAGRFKKGQSGNPGGKKPMDDETKAILKAAAPDAAKLMVKMMNDPKVQPKLRMQAGEVVMDRVYGKATQPIEGGMDNTIKIVMGGAAKYAD